MGRRKSVPDRWVRQKVLMITKFVGGPSYYRATLTKLFAANKFELLFAFLIIGATSLNRKVDTALVSLWLRVERWTVGPNPGGIFCQVCGSDPCVRGNVWLNVFVDVWGCHWHKVGIIWPLLAEILSFFPSFFFLNPEEALFSLPIPATRARWHARVCYWAILPIFSPWSFFWAPHCC